MWFKTINLAWVLILDEMCKGTGTCSYIKDNISLFYLEELLVDIINEDFFLYGLVKPFILCGKSPVKVSILLGR